MLYEKEVYKQRKKVSKEGMNCRTGCDAPLGIIRSIQAPFSSPCGCLECGSTLHIHDLTKDGQSSRDSIRSPHDKSAVNLLHFFSARDGFICIRGLLYIPGQ